MAYETWVTSQSHWCNHVHAETSMMERRLYPSEVMPDFPPYRVTARKCALGTACNLAGFPCKWAYKDLGFDPFEPTAM